MRDMFVRYASSGDLGEFAKWVVRTQNVNLFDARVLEYPTTRLLKVIENGKAVAYLPVQTALVLDSLAKRPDLTASESALALARLIEYLNAEAARTGMGEIYMPVIKEANHEVKQQNKMAVRHGFKLLDWFDFYRMQV